MRASYQNARICYSAAFSPLSPRREMSFLTEVDVYPLRDLGVRNPSLLSRAATSLIVSPSRRNWLIRSINWS